MRPIRTIAAIAAAVLMSGCATQQLFVPLAEGTWTKSSPRVGVAMSEIPKPDTRFPGADCLLCIAVASAANASLTSHARSLAVEDVAAISRDMADAVRKKGGHAEVLSEPLRLDDLPDFGGSGPNVARKDFTALRSRYNIDKLLLVQVRNLGYERGYASYVPTSEPRARVETLGALIDLRNNSYEWYLPVVSMRAPNGTWDEAPKFPSLTNAYYQAIEANREHLLRGIDR